MKEYHVRVRVPKAEARNMQRILKAGKGVEDAGDDEVLASYTAKFADGFQADIIVYNAPTEDGGPWVDAMLFDKGGCEVSAADPGDSLLGRYVFEAGKYVVRVLAGVR